VKTPELYKEYPLILSTGARIQAFFHSEHRQIPWLREIAPDPNVEIHPKTAKSLDIIDGDWVYIENHRGRVKARARVTPVVPAWMVMVAHSWWLPEEDGTKPHFYGIWDYNVCNLFQMGDHGRCGFGGGSQRSALCKVYKIQA
jgi:anaerobic selenocysteine-containing dehydrogenase